MPMSRRTPKPRRTRKQRAAVDPELLPFLRDRESEDYPGLPYSGGRHLELRMRNDATGELAEWFLDELAAAWPAVRTAVVAEWQRLHPGQRPACWWVLDWNGDLEYLKRHRIEPPVMDFHPTFGIEELTLWRPVRYAAWRRWRAAVDAQ